MCKRIFKFELQLSSYWQNIKFSRYCLKFHSFTKIVIFQVYLQLLRPTASSYTFYDRAMSGILFFIFASCEPLILVCSSLLPKPILIHKTQYTVAYPGWHTPRVQTEDGVLAPPGKLKNGTPRRRFWMGEGGSMLEVIISFSDNVIGIRLLKIELTGLKCACIIHTKIRNVIRKMRSTL